jgi:hypothetical protein
MVSENRNTRSVQQKPHKPIRFKPIRFSAHEVALMAQIANEFSPEFCRAATPHLSQAFLGYYLEKLVSDESPFIPRAIQNYFSVKPSRGGFTWIPR